MGRPKINDEKLILRLPAGTLAQLDAVRADGETRTDVLRQAVERELKRRERAKKSG